MIIKHFWVDIENSSGDRLGAGPVLASNFKREKPLDKSGQVSFRVNPADRNYGTIEKRRIAVCRYIDINGDVQEFGSCVIERSEIVGKDDGSISIKISGLDISRELTGRSVKQLAIGSGAGGEDDAPDQIIALAPPGWTMIDGTTLQDVYIGYDGQSVLNALVSLAEGIGEHWRLGAGREIIWLQSINQFVSSGIRALRSVPDPDEVINTPEVAIIKSLKEIEDVQELYTRIYPRGAGNGDAITRFDSLVASAPAGFTVSVANQYIEQDAPVITYGNIEKEVDFKNISPLTNSIPDKAEAANMLMVTAAEWLRRHSSPQRFYKIELSKVDQVLEPGTTLRVVYKKEVNGIAILDLNEDLNIISVVDEINDKRLNTISVIVSTIDRAPMTDADIAISQLEQSRAVSTHAQLNANARNIDRKGIMDDANPLAEAFWFGTEVASIKSVVLRFKIDPLRSTVSAVNGQSTTTPSGGASATPSGGGSTTPSGGGSTSGGGGATTPTSSTAGLIHSHEIPVLVDGTPDVNLGGNVSGGKIQVVASSGAARPMIVNASGTDHNHTVTIPNHSHSTPNHSHSTPNHSHATPDHEHTFTPNVSLAYGIFEETGGNTLEQTDLVIKINGVTFSGSIDSIAGGWYEANITDELIDTDFSPLQSNNEIEYSTAVEKTAQITTSLSIVDIVQAVSVL